MNKFFFLIIFCFSITAAEHCLDSLNEIFKNKDFKNTKIQEFLNLQSSITMHKLAYATLRSSNSKAEFRIENEILELLKKQISNNDDPELKAIYDEFKSPQNKVSRNSLAKILPLIKDLLNDQSNEGSSFEREKFNINQDDLKMLSILAEKESQKKGLYNSKQFKNHSSDNSILNFVKVINSSIKNTNGSKQSILTRMDQRIDEMNKKSFNLISDLSTDCEEYLRACSKKDESNIILPNKVSSLLLAISDEIEAPKKYKYLKYGDTWLYTGKNSNKINLGTQKIRSKYNKDISDKYFQEDVKTIHEHLVKRVLRDMPYFISKEDLLKDKELTVALAQALDQNVMNAKNIDDRVFYYKGNTYRFPELYKKPLKELKFSDNYIKDKMFKFGLVVTGNYPDLSPSKLETCPDHVESCKDLLKERTSQYSERGHRGVVIYKDEFYSMKDLTPLKKSKQSFLDALYLSDKGNNNPNPFKLDEDEIRQIANEIRVNNSSVIIGQKLKHISGAEVDFSKEYRKAKRKFDIASKDKNNVNEYPSRDKINSISPNVDLVLRVKKAIVDGKKHTSYGDNYINTSTLEVVKLKSSKDATRLAAVSNKDTFYISDSQLNYTASGESTDAKRKLTSVDGFKLHRDIQNETRRINSLADDLKIIEHHKNITNTCEFYTIVDKKNANIKVLNNEGNLLLYSEVLLGRAVSDKKTKYTVYSDQKKETNNTTGAGAFKFKGIQKVSQTGERFIAIDGIVGGISRAPRYSPNLLSLFNDNDLSNNRATSGGIVLPGNKFNQLIKYIDSGCPYYVLPEEKENRFIAGDQEIFYNKKEYKAESDEIKVVVDPDFKINSKTQSFIDTLESEKRYIIDELKLTNEEYNDLVKLSVGILGVESKFGNTDIFDNGVSLNRYGLKNSWLGGISVFTAKAIQRGELDWDGSARSRGLTQIKNVEDYMEKSRYSYINSKNVNNPKEAAIATMYVLGDKLRQLKRTDNEIISQEDRMDYLYFFYMGQSRKIADETATPDLNPKVMAVNQIASKVHILTK